MNTESIEKLAKEIFIANCENDGCESGMRSDAYRKGIETAVAVMNHKSINEVMQVNLPETIYLKVSVKDRMPKEEGRYIVFRYGEPIPMDCRQFKNGEMVFTTPNGMAWKGYKEFSWLEETAAPGYTIDDMRKCFEAGIDCEASYNPIADELYIKEHRITFDEYINSLQPKQ